MFCVLEAVVSWTAVIHINKWNARLFETFSFPLNCTHVAHVSQWASLAPLCCCCWVSMQIIGKFSYFLNVWIFTYNYWPPNIIPLSYFVLKSPNNLRFTDYGLHTPYWPNTKGPPQHILSCGSVYFRTSSSQLQTQTDVHCSKKF